MCCRAGGSCRDGAPHSSHGRQQAVWRRHRCRRSWRPDDVIGVGGEGDGGEGEGLGGGGGDEGGGAGVEVDEEDIGDALAGVDEGDEFVVGGERAVERIDAQHGQGGGRVGDDEQASVAIVQHLEAVATGRIRGGLFVGGVDRFAFAGDDVDEELDEKAVRSGDLDVALILEAAHASPGAESADVASLEVDDTEGGGFVAVFGPLLPDQVAGVWAENSHLSGAEDAGGVELGVVEDDGVAVVLGQGRCRARDELGDGVWVAGAGVGEEAGDGQLGSGVGGGSWSGGLLLGGW